MALAPATPADRSIPAVADQPGSAVYMPYIAYSIALQYPDFRPQDLLSEAGLAHYDEYIHGGCLPFAVALTGDATPAQFLRPDAMSSRAVRRFTEANRYNTGPLAAPLFVASGATDVSVSAPTVAEAAAEQCRHGTAVRYRDYPADHDGMIAAAAADMLAWIADRFDDRPPPSTCG